MTAAQLAAIPAELKTCRNWVCWKYETQPGRPKPGKVPYNARTGYRATTTKPDTFSTFAEAVKAAATGRARDGQSYAGIGFAFTDSDFFGVDLDHVGDAGKISAAEAAEIVNALQTYAERSPSGTGFHILARGRLPGAAVKNDAAGVEIYETGRFFTVTGDRLPDSTPTVRDCTEAIRAFYDRYSTHRAPQGDAVGAGDALDSNPQAMPTAHTTVRAGRLTDSEILAKAMQDTKFARLWAGDLTDYDGDHSRADNALCYSLAFWTAHDLAQVDRLFRQSGLMRPKWDSRRGRSTYGADTIARAADAQRDNYGDRRPQDRATAEAAAMQAGDALDGNPQGDAVDQIGATVADQLARGRFEQEQAAYTARAGIRTGFAELDRLTDGGLFPGLYVLGGLPGAGKTTFALQLADQISAAGHDVLFFSLEMSWHEIISKSLARLCAQKHGTRDALTALSIRRGRGAGLAREALAEYSRTAAGRLAIIESEATTAAGICDRVRAELAAGKAAPVVVVDYLQLLAQGGNKQTAKEATDKAIRELKLLSRREQITVIAISSLNRDNYSKSLALDALKESGAVEYSADVVAGLQFRIMNGKPNAQQIETAKTQCPREIELRVIKNRFGRLFGAEFDYFPHCDLFAEPATAAAELAADRQGDAVGAEGGEKTCSPKMKRY